MKAVESVLSHQRRGAWLFSFAIHWIKGGKSTEFILRNWRLVRVATTKPQRKLFSTCVRRNPALPR